MTEALSLDRRRALHRRALWLEYFTVGWNVIEGVVAIGAGIIAGSVALIGFGVDSSIEVISALGLLWRLRKAGPETTVAEESGAERRALYVVAATFFLLAAYITFEAGTALIGQKRPDRSTVGAGPERAVAGHHAGPGLHEAAHRPRDGQSRPGRRRGRDLGVLVSVAGPAGRRGAA
jgi:divalent metal cation (Fe/Co/Zn/Cd) transporter